jgi:HlyD family secretion protein
MVLEGAVRALKKYGRAAVVLAALASLLLAVRFYSPSGAAPPDPPPLVRVLTASPQRLPRTLIAAGTIEPVAEVDLGAKEAGTLKSVSVQIGEHVHAGEVLASLDTAQLAADVDAAQAQLQVALANGAATARAYDRVANIRNSGAIAPEQVDERGADAVAQKAQISVAKANLAAAEARLAAAVVTAPMDGIIAARNAEPGQFAAPGGPPLFSLIGDQGEIFRASLPQDQLGLVRPGMKVLLSLPAGEATGHVIAIDPAIDAATHLGTVRVALDRDAALRPGAFVEASIDIGSVTTLALPQSALVAGEDGFHVVVVRRGKAQPQPVTLADLPGNRSALVPIAGGVAVGDTVVLYAGADLRDGQPVRPVH